METQRPITEPDNSYEEFYEQVDTVLMGRKTYEQLMNELSPEVYPYENAISYIFTSKGEKTVGKRHFVNRDVVEVVKKLRAQSGKVI